MIVLDTNVLSALMAPDLNRAVVIWLDQQPSTSIWTTAVNIFESRSGINLLPEGKRKRDLHTRLDILAAKIFPDRILPFDREAAERAAHVAGMRIRDGLNIGSRDTQIAGISLARGATLATRNIKDFEGLGITLMNPWQV